MAVIDTQRTSGAWPVRWSTAVVAAGIAAWQIAAMWWVVLAIGTNSAWARVAWGAAALLLLAGGQALCVATVWAPLAWLARRRRTMPVAAAAIGAMSWLLSYGAASTLRQLSWAGDGYASLSTAVVDAPGVKAWLPVVGAQGVDGLLMVLVALLALSLLSETAKLPLLFVAALALFAMSIPSWIPPTPSTSASGPALHVMVLQSNDDTDAAWTTRKRDANLDLLARAIDAAPRGAIVVTPETFIAELPPATPEGRWAELLEHVGDRGVHLLLGMPQLERDDDGLHVMNAVVQVSPQHQSVYAKERLVPGGEYLPWPALMQAVYAMAFPDRLRSESSAPPELTRPMHVAGSELGMSICYEQAFAYTMAERASAAGWLANLSDDSWIDSAGYRNQMLATARLRAMESAKPLLRVSSGGRSVLIDHEGRVAAGAHGTATQLVDVELTPRSGLTPYAKTWRAIAAAPIALWSLAVLSLSLGLRSEPAWQLAEGSTP